MIEASRSRMPLLHMLTKMCAIVGGVFAVMGVLDALVFKMLSLLASARPK